MRNNKCTLIILSLFILYNQEVIGQVDSILKYSQEIFSSFSKNPNVKEIKKNTPLSKRKYCSDSSLYFMSKYTTYQNIDSISTSNFNKEYEAKKNVRVYFLIVFGQNTILSYNDSNSIKGTIYYLFKNKRYKEWWTIKRGLKYAKSTDFVYLIKEKKVIFSQPFD